MSNSILFIYLFGFIINYFFTKILIKYSRKLNLIDYPEQRKMHKDSTPIVGGLAIFITTF